MFETVRQDVVYGLRLFRQSPGFVAMACASLAIGIGANTAVYSVVRASLWDELPVHEPERLVLFNWTAARTPAESDHDGWMTRTPEGLRSSTSYPFGAFEAFRDSSAFSELFAFAPIYRLNLAIDGRAELGTGILANGSYFDGLGLTSEIGRLLGDEDDVVSAEPAVVLSHELWMSRFGGSPDALGRPIQLNGTSFVVVGVTPRGFRGTLQVGSTPAVYVPLAHSELVSQRGDARDNPRWWWVQIMGRLAPGETTTTAEAAMKLQWARWVKAEWTDEELRPVSASGEAGAVPLLTLSPGGQGMHEVRGYLAQPLFVTFAAAGLVLLIACVNLANLLLARGGARRKEMALRLSMGAAPRRLLRQLMTESLMLSSVGAAAGLLLAYWGTPAVLGLVPQSLGEPLELDVRIDTVVLAFTTGLTVLAGLVFGLVPAVRASRFELTPALKGFADSTGRGTPKLTLSRGLIVAQVAMSLMLLVLAGLFTRSLQELQKIEPGFDPQRMLVFRIDPTLNGYEGDRLAALYQRIQARIDALPEVRATTLSPFSLLAGRGSWSSVFAEGASTDGESMRVHVHAVATNFLDTMSIPILAGRDLDATDRESAVRVAVVNETFARQTFGAGRDAIGRRFGFGDPERRSDIEIVGVARDAKNDSLRHEILPTVYVPYSQRGRLRSMTFSIRTRGEPTAIVSDVRAIVRTIDPALPLFEVKSLEQQMGETLSQERQFAGLAALFGLIALSLTCIGLYGVLSQTVQRRTREFGIRLALGARGRDVEGLVMRELRLVAIGIGVGLGATFLGSRAIASMLYGTTTHDPTSIAGASLLMVVVAAAAAYVPARRAIGVDPATVLRSD